MAGEDAAHVLDSEVPLDHRLTEVTERSSQGDHDAEHERRAQVAGVLAERGYPPHHQYSDPECDGHAANQALHGLVGADRR